MHEILCMNLYWPMVFSHRLLKDNTPRVIMAFVSKIDWIDCFYWTEDP